MNRQPKMHPNVSTARRPFIACRTNELIVISWKRKNRNGINNFFAIILTLLAVNVHIGRKAMLSLVSGYCVHTKLTIPIIAPD